MPATLGIWIFKFSFDVFSVPDTCKDECGQPGGSEKRALIDAVCQMDQMIASGVLVTQTLIVIFVPSGL